jgi:hypothetical protein
MALPTIVSPAPTSAGTQDIGELLNSLVTNTTKFKNSVSIIEKNLHLHRESVEQELDKMDRDLNTLTAKVKNFHKDFHTAVDNIRKAIGTPLNIDRETIAAGPSDQQTQLSSSIASATAILEWPTPQTQVSSPEPQSSATSRTQTPRGDSHNSSSRSPSEPNTAVSTPVPVDRLDVASRTRPSGGSPNSLFVPPNNSDGEIPGSRTSRTQAPRSDSDSSLSSLPSETYATPSTPVPADGQEVVSAEAHDEDDSDEPPEDTKNYFYPKTSKPKVRSFIYPTVTLSNSLYEVEHYETNYVENAKVLPKSGNKKTRIKAPVKYPKDR